MTATERQYQTALADLESKLAAAATAEQIHRGLIERSESGEPVPDDELAEAAEDARQAAVEVARAEGAARAYPRYGWHQAGRQRALQASRWPEGHECHRGVELA
jgi:hypothetical protein